VSGGLSYNDVDDVSTTSANLSYGRYLTDVQGIVIGATAVGVAVAIKEAND
jgi:hypothetical protein